MMAKPDFLKAVGLAEWRFSESGSAFAEGWAEWQRGRGVDYGALGGLRWRF